MRPAKAKHNIGTYARPLISSALIAGGLMQLAAPVLAQTVPAANDTISNTAAATYDDGDGATVETKSNTVTIKVAKVAGIYVEGKGFSNSNTATLTTFNRNDTIYSNFDVKNTGNDGVQFKVPKLANVSGNGTDSNTFQRVEYFDSNVTTNPNFTTNGGWVAVTSATGANSQVIPVNGILKVRVVLIIKSTATDTSSIIVTLGQTSTPGAINLKRGDGVGEDTNDNDIYTVDVTTAGANVIVGGVAANGVREASAQQQVSVNAPKQAVPSITLTNTAPVQIPGQNKDNVEYNASVTVVKLDANGADNADLAPTSIKLNSSATVPTPAAPGTGTATPRVIVALPLPATVTLSALPVAPTNWTAVYATTTGTVDTVVWSTTPPALGDVKQVAFIYTPATGTTATTGASLPASATAYTGFNVKVTTTGVGTVDAIASVVGTTPDASGNPDPTKPAKADATDSFTTTRIAANSPIFNGPRANAEAKGPGGDNNTDFTNKSVTIPSGDAKRTNGVLDKTSASTSAKFDNAVLNTNSGTADIYLLPTVPATPGDLPTGTTVKITNTDGSDSRTYTYTGSAYTTLATGVLPIKLSVASGKTASYKVDVTLPATIDQLKGYPVPVTAFTGGTLTAGMVVLPVVSGTGSTATTAPTAQNTTIDRAYTGFIDLIKEVRVLDSVGDQNQPSTGAFSYLSGDVSSVKAVPGKFIQYRIRAVNISTPANTLATDSQLLKAANLQIVEDGIGSNTWATQTTHESSTAKTLLGTTPVTSTITYDDGKSDSAPNINVYTVKFADQITPNATTDAPAFVFVRKVNQPALKGGILPASPSNP